MDLETYGNIIICGNFAKLQDKKPEPFNYDESSKWIEKYSFDWRETLGDAICNCAIIEVNYAPYYGFDYFHNDSCNLMRKLEKYPGISNFYEIYLPSINNYSTSVKSKKSRQIWVYKQSRTSKIE